MIFLTALWINLLCFALGFALHQLYIKGRDNRDK
jgi:hypothetical protein